MTFFQIFMLIVTAVSLFFGLGTAHTIIYNQGRRYRYDYKNFLDFLKTGLLFSAGMFVAIATIPSVLYWFIFVKG